MKIRSCTPKQKILRNSFKLAATVMIGASQICQSAFAQTSASIQIFNTAEYQYSFPDPNDPKKEIIIKGDSAKLQAELIDPFGRVTSCDGGLLSDYTGFSVGLYEPLNDVGDFGSATVLTATVPPSQVSASNRFIGLDPNFYNINPFFLTNSDQGKFNFLFDDSRGQVDIGRVYILVVKPPANSSLGGRRIKITITSRVGNVVSYTATSLDGKEISIEGGSTSVNGTIDVSNAATVGLGLAVFSLSISSCDAVSLQILKTGDRAAAQPGDIVIYRLNIRNLSTTTISQPEIRDDLPLGFQYAEGSVKAEFGGSQIPVSIEKNGRNLVFRPEIQLPNVRDSRTLTIVYAAQITNDAIRGTGINQATVQGTRGDNKSIVRDGPVSHKLRIRPGILSDCGTLVGRVFVDKNFDGEQQPGEPGIPNAVVYMDDGNRIVTDANGLYSLSNVLSGSRTLAIDLTSVPGYTLAPNLYFAERNSQSRLVRLAPGSLNRVNFGVTPVARGLSSNINSSPQQGGAK
jgi:uncharacterized repeat protein (TIGR01451 family)